MSFIFSLLLPVLVSSDTCYRAQSAYPNASYSTQHRVFWRSYCPVEVSCCSGGAEQEMIRKTEGGLTNTVFSTLDRYLEMFDNHTLMPLYFVPGLDHYTYGIKPFTKTTYADVLYAIIKLVVVDPASCIDDGQLDQITIGALPHVKNITNYLYSLQTNLEAVYETILAVRHYNITKQCTGQVIRNGIPVSPDLGNVLCPVCAGDETATSRTCKSLCYNTVRGCFADVTSIIPVYEKLLEVMDEQHLKLTYMMVSRHGALSKIIAILKQIISSDFTDNIRDNPFASDYRDSSNYLTKYPRMYSKNKGFQGIFSAPETVPCTLSVQATTSCWSGTHVGFDSGYVRPFTEQGQMMNPVLAYQDEAGPYILEAKETLEKALEMSKRGRNSELLLPIRSEKGPQFDKNSRSNALTYYAPAVWLFLISLF